MPRQRIVKPVYLTDAASRRVAIRFQGVLPVLVDIAGQQYNFETLDYSEVGLYIRELESGAEPLLSDGQEIAGRIGRDDAASVLFRGHVVRTHHKTTGIHYAVKVEEMESMQEDKDLP